MLQRFAQFCIALLEFFEQPHVLDAITAWAAKVSRSLICLSEKGPASLRRMRIAPIEIPSRSNGTASLVRCPASAQCSRAIREFGFEFSGDVMDVNRLPVDDGPAGRYAASEPQRS